MVDSLFDIFFCTGVNSLEHIVILVRKGSIGCLLVAAQQGIFIYYRYHYFSQRILIAFKKYGIHCVLVSVSGNQYGGLL